VNNYMALLGWSAKDDREIFSIAELREAFDLSGVNNSNSKFDYDKCKWVNGEHLKELSPADLQRLSAPFLDSAGIPSADPRIPASLELARDRAQLLSEIPGVIATIFTETVDYDAESVEKVKSRDGMPEIVAALATGLAGVEDWTVDNIKTAIAASAEGIGQKMGALMFPCRVATMGSTSGADLVPVLELLGKDETVRRLEGFAGMVG